MADDEVVLYLHHDKHYDLVLDESGDEKALGALSDSKAEKAQREDHVLVGGQVHKSLGIYDVAGGEGVQRRHKIGVEQPGNVTTVLIPPGYDASPQALTHLLDTLLDRNADASALTGVSGTDDRIVARVAALLDVDVVEVPQ